METLGIPELVLIFLIAAVFIGRRKFLDKPKKKLDKKTSTKKNKKKK
ncbi:hypothetical protein JXA63_04765 [Candidatus Woesebacteria bacterium]|nr:hypothetical protein [Candidatus Woesebacteria bacterium]